MSEVREGYKMTELGEIPSDWDIQKLEDITSRIGDGIHSTPKYSEEGTIAFVNGNNIVNGSLKIPLDNKMIETTEYGKYIQYLNDNSILLSINGTIGKVGFYNNEKVLLGKSIAYINPNEGMNRSYLYYLLSTNFIRNYFIKELTGTTIKNLSLKTIRETLVPVPNLIEQQKIASILSTVDEQIDETKQLIVKTKELKKGLMQQLLKKGIGHTEFKQTELGAIPATWEIKKFEDIMQPKGEGIRRGPFGGALKKEIFVDDGYAVYEQQHVIHNLRDTFRYYITEEKFDELKSFEVLPGDVLISCSGTVGKVLIVPEKSPLGVINQALLRLRPKLKETDIKFLYYLLTSEFVQKRMLDMTHGSALKNMVSIGELKSILLAFPNTLEEQQKIASILSTVDAQIEVYEEEKAKYEELKKGLMQQLLTGQIRVKI